MINLCIPTYNRYDLLGELISSAERGTVKPDHYYIIDNGGRLTSTLPKVTVFNFKQNIGVSRSWNYFLENIQEERIISNDDIVFAEDTIQKMVEAEGGMVFVSTLENLNRYSLFLIRDNLVDTVGKFDDSISPNYGYFEDNDFDYRMQSIYQIKPVSVESAVKHVGSATLKNFTQLELKNHHERFRLAERNYIKKHGGLPGKELY